jgi:colanic acid biosynthesis glycosyl transferase WcaI
MRILLLTAYFPPDTGSASHLFYELGKSLLSLGHEVKVITSLPNYFPSGDMKKYKHKLFMREKYDELETLRIAAPEFPRHIPLARGIWQFYLAFVFFLSLSFLRNVDVMLIYSPPLTLGLTGWIIGRIKKIPVVLNVQDLFPQSAIDLGVLKNRVLIKFFNALESFIYKRIDFITVHSMGNKKHILRKGIKSEKVEIVNNWVDTEYIGPENGDGKDFKNEFDLSNNFIVSFAGVIGYSQDMDVIVQAAKKLEVHENIHFVIVGDGVQKQATMEKVKEIGLKNISFIPMLPREKYPEVLYASDVCLSTLKKHVKTPVVPSKILSIMASGRPLVAAMNLSGDAPKIIEEACCGYTLPPENAAQLSEAILELYRNPEKRERFGKKARKYAEENFSLPVAVKKYKEIFSKLIAKA